MKITLIDPVNPSYMCWGICSINPYLYLFAQEYGYEFEFIDCNKLVRLNCALEDQEKQILGDIAGLMEKNTPDIILFYYKIFSLPFVFEVIKKIKAVNLKPTIVLLGVNPETVKLIKENGCGGIDCFLTGDTEAALKKFLDDYSKERITNKTYDGGESEDLNLINGDFSFYKQDKKLLFIPYEISRGCKFNCDFCAKQYKNFRFKSAGKVVSDLRILAEMYGSVWIAFLDEYFNFDCEYLENFCSSVAAQNLNIPFACNWIIDKPLDMGLIKKLKCAGLKRLFLTAESFPGREYSDEKLYDKKYFFDYLKKAVKEIKTIGVDVSLTIVTNSHSDTEESFNLAEELVGGLPKDIEIRVEQALVLPGSKFWKLYKEGKMAVSLHSNHSFPSQKRYLFGELYLESIFLSPQYWAIENENINNAVKMFLRETRDFFGKRNKFGINEYKYDFKDKELVMNFNINEYITNIKIRAGALSAPLLRKNCSAGTRKVNVLLNNHFAGSFNLKEELVFYNYNVKPKQVVKPGKYNMNFVTENDNLAVDWVEFETLRGI